MLPVSTSLEQCTYMKNEGSSGEYKIYICLFTCTSTRAVHLEVVTDLSEESFLQAFRRFAARRSLPRLVISDNVSTYMGTQQAVSITHTEISPYEEGYNMVFHPKESPMVWGLLGKADWYSEDIFKEGPWLSLHYLDNLTDNCC